MADNKPQIDKTFVVDYVNPHAREWSGGQGGTMFFVEVNFTDGSTGSVSTQVKEKVDEVIASLQQLRGTPQVFKVVDKGDYNNIQQWGIREYPGKPEGLWKGGGGGGRNGGGMSNAQAGYMAAASALGPTFQHDHANGVPFEPSLMAAKVVQLGELLTDALFNRKPPATQQEQTTVETPSGNGEAGLPSRQVNPPTLAQVKAIKEVAAAKGWTDEQLKAQLDGREIADLSSDEADMLVSSWG